MLPALTQMVCSKQLLPQLSSGLHALGHLQLPWSYVKDMSQSLKPGGQPLQNLQHLGRQQCTVCSQQLWHHQHQQLRGFNSSSALYSKQLGDVMKVDLLQHKTPDEVEHIWLAHHASSESHIATVMSKDEHTILTARAAASPLFVLPLSKKPGSFQTLLLQWQPPKRLLVTTVEEFKQWGPQAPPHLTVQLFDDVVDSHGLVLARGDLINPGLINAAEGRTLLELARAFYSDAAAYQMVFAFNHQPDKFDFQQLCRELGVSTAGRPSPAQGAPQAH